MPTLPLIDPAFQSLKNALVTKFLTTPSQAVISPPPAEVPIPTVTGIGIAMPSVLESTPAQQIVIFVEDASDCQLETLYNQVNVEVAGAPIAMLRSGRFVGQAPPMIGSSIGPYAPLHYNVPQVTAGTFGAVATDSAGKHYILGSNHVMAYNGRAPHGTPIVSPGTLDDSVTFTKIGSRSRFVELHPAAWPVTQAQVPANMNEVDCALAELTPAALAKMGALPAGVAPAAPVNSEVHKTGRTTQTTHGSLCILDWEGFIDLSFGTFYFKNLMGVLGNDGAFAAPGDSGAVVIDDVTNQPIGMVVARVYSSGGFLPGAPLAGPFTGYIVLVCSMVEVCNQLLIQTVITV